MTNQEEIRFDVEHRVRERIKYFEAWERSLPEHAGAAKSAVLRTVIAYLKHDLSDGVCRCVRNNGMATARFVDPETNLWCLHGKNDVGGNSV